MIKIQVFKDSSRVIRAKDPKNPWKKTVQSMYISVAGKPVPEEIVVDIPEDMQPLEAGTYTLDLNDLALYPDHRDYNSPKVNTSRLPMFLKKQAS